MKTANISWMAHTPLGSLKSTNTRFRGRTSYFDGTTTYERERLALVEDFKCGYLNQAELALALKELAQTPLAISAKLFNEVQVPIDCGNCAELLTVPDMFGTGDSPDDFECRGSPGVCPAVRRQINIVDTI